MTQPEQALPEQASGDWWNDGDALRTRLFDAISLLLPSGEQFVIDAVSDWLRDKAEASHCPALIQEVQRFIREELAHQRAHRLYNERLAVHTPARQLEHRIATAVSELASLDLQMRLGFSAAFEHLTAMLSMEILRPNSAWLGNGESHQVRLWRWHCHEEINHSHVALDVSKAMGVGAGRRTLAFCTAALYLGMDVAIALIAMSRADLRAKRVKPLQLVMQGARFALLASPGLVRMIWRSLAFIAGRPLRHRSAVH